MNYLTRITRTFRISTSSNILRYLTSQNVANTPLPRVLLTQSPFIKNPWIWQQNDGIKFPIIHKNKIELPNGVLWIPTSIESPVLEKTIEAPSKENSNVTKEAARLIVIRRKKMKKHKLKKLRKRMKFEWAKLRQRRELKKEKDFQAILIQQCKEGEAFSAEQYVQERIDKLNEIIIPRYWKGKRLPEFLVREKMGLPPKK
ncbi:uncharacterized protein LOC108912498 isoform X2 [Anoplophora glabripennis]|uniref:uncharacterized protein LOC108912498 isoform X2 n=1 Tax=Anoplophora glabripennis TaxID=217634 RepID=UPI00087512EC|nr:uncharacterized protein LOC108912498 isoform X2 [Anoplophora glabripennis]